MTSSLLTSAFRTAFLVTDEGMVICSTAGEVQRVNPAATRLTGVSEEEAKGRPFTEAFSALATEEILAAALKQPSPFGTRLPASPSAPTTLTVLATAVGEGQECGTLVRFRTSLLHDVRAAIGGISSVLQLVVEDMVPEDQFERFLNMAWKETSRLREMVLGRREGDSDDQGF